MLGIAHSREKQSLSLLAEKVKNNNKEKREQTFPEKKDCGQRQRFLKKKTNVRSEILGRLAENAQKGVRCQKRISNPSAIQCSPFLLQLVNVGEDVLLFYNDKTSFQLLVDLMRSERHRMDPHSPLRQVDPSAPG